MNQYDAAEVARLFMQLNAIPENTILRRGAIQQAMDILCSDAELAFCVTTVAKLQTKTEANDGGRSLREYLVSVGKSIADDPDRMRKFALFAVRVLGLVSALVAESLLARDEPRTNTTQPGAN